MTVLQLQDIQCCGIGSAIRRRLNHPHILIGQNNQFGTHQASLLRSMNLTRRALQHSADLFSVYFQRTK